MPALPSRLGTICIDCDDVAAMARFYEAVLGWTPTVVEPEWILMRDPGGGTGLSFQQEAEYVRPLWPETAEQQQKMMHLEIPITGGQAALDDAQAIAVAAGGTLSPAQFRDDIRVILDPAGHPLCLFLDD